MNLQRLRHFSAVVRCRSFLKAAEELGISQPALSKSVRALEREVGSRLVERGRFGAVPTTFGEALVRHAGSIEAELRSAREEISALRSASKGHVRVGCGPSEATRLLPMALERLCGQAPGIRVTVLYGLNEALFPMVLQGDVDFALSSIPTTGAHPDLRHVPVCEDSAVVVARAGHRLAALRKPIRPQNLLGMHWVLARHLELERRALDNMFIESGLPPPEAAVETTSAVLMKAMVMHGDYLTFLPREMIYWEERSGQLWPVRVAGGPSWRRVVGISQRARARLSPAAEALVAALEAAAASLRHRG